METKPVNKNFFTLLDEQIALLDEHIAEKHKMVKDLFAKRHSDVPFRSKPISEETLKLCVYYRALLVEKIPKEEAHKMAFDKVFMAKYNEEKRTRWLTYDCPSYRNWIVRSLDGAYFLYADKK